MRAVVTRVASASVQVEGTTIGAISRGFLILLGVGPQDGEAQCKALAEKILSLRVFEDETGKMNLGQILVVSQFTLYGNCRKGRRPSFTEAAPPALGEAMYERFLELCRLGGFPPQHGKFGAHMEVASVNDGPVTLLLDTDQLMEARRSS